MVIVWYVVNFSISYIVTYSSNNIGSSATSSSTFKSQFSDLDEIYPDGQILETPNLKEFSFTDLKTATKNFKTDSLLGEGGFGKVFKGWVDEKTLAPSKFGTGMIVAIKKLNSESMQGLQEWQVLISTANFINIVYIKHLISTFFF